jgi:hypothetical protein
VTKLSEKIDTTLRYNPSSGLYGVAAPRLFVPSSSLHWYPITSALPSAVDVLPDAGRAGILAEDGFKVNFTQSNPAQRPTKGTGINGRTYIVGDGAATTPKCMVALGTVGDTINGANPHTIACVFAVPTGMASGFQCLLANWSSGVTNSGGSVLGLASDGGQRDQQGLDYIGFHGTNPPRFRLSRKRIDTTETIGAPRAYTVIIRLAGSMGATPGAPTAVTTPIQASMRIDGTTVAIAGTVNATDQSQPYYAPGFEPLLFARYSNGTDPVLGGAMRLYDLHIDDSHWSDGKCQAYEALAYQQWGAPY